MRKLSKMLLWREFVENVDCNSPKKSSKQHFDRIRQAVAIQHSLYKSCSESRFKEHLNTKPLLKAKLKF